MNLTVNGKEESLAGRELLTVSALLDELKVTDPLYVTVELNGEIIERKSHHSIIVRDGDSIEFLYFMGGGLWQC